MTPVPLPALGFGTAGVGNHRRALTDDEAAALLEAAWSAGVRHFDTAPHYGLGLAERRLGAFLRGRPRDEFVVSTKVGRLLRPRAGAGHAGGAREAGVDPEGFVVPADTERVWDFTAEGVRRSLDGSLERLGLDRIDVVYLHDPERWDTEGALRAGLPALDDLRREGTVGAMGVASMSTPALLAGACAGGVDVLMAAGRYTLASPDLAGDVLDACAAGGVDVVAAAVFNTGVLGDPGAGATFDYGPTPPDLAARVRRIAEVCAAHGVPLRAAAVQFPLRHSQVRSVVVGGDTPDQVRENADNAARPCPDRLWADLAAAGLIPA